MIKHPVDKYPFEYLPEIEIVPDCLASDGAEPCSGYANAHIRLYISEIKYEHLLEDHNRLLKQLELLETGWRKIGEGRDYYSVTYFADELKELRETLR